MKIIPAMIMASTCLAATASFAAASDPFSGTWAADMSTVAPEQAALKSQSLAITQTPDGYAIRQTSVKQDKSGGTSSTWIDTKVVLDGKAHKGGMGEDRTCNREGAMTIHCVISMGPNGFEEIYTLSGGGKGLTDTMKGKDPDGKEQSMSTVYAKAGSAPPPPLSSSKAPQRIVTQNGECEVTIPAGWTVDRSMREASSPDFGVDVHVFTTDYASNMKSLAELKALNIGAYKPVKTFEDTPQRLWYQYAPHFQNNNGWYVAVLGKTGTCNLEISFKNSVIPDENMARQIALSLKPAK
jgi:hypothetical protein